MSNDAGSGVRITWKRGTELTLKGGSRRVIGRITKLNSKCSITTLVDPSGRCADVAVWADALVNMIEG